MRTMVKSNNPKVKLKVDRVLVLKNGWEYFLEKADENGIAFGLVCGFENEMGDVYLPELSPYIISQSSGTLRDSLPAMNWIWEDEK